MDRRLICVMIVAILALGGLVAEEADPVLFKLTWNVLPDNIDAMLATKVFQFKVNAAIRENERIELEDAAVYVYAVDGVAYPNIPARMSISFYKADVTRDQVSLYKADIRLVSHDEAGAAIDLKTVFKTLFYAFIKKYTIPIDPAEESLILENYNCATVLYDVTISITLDSTAENLIVTYENTGLKAQIEAKLAALDKGNVQTVTPVELEPPIAPLEPVEDDVAPEARLVITIDAAGSPFMYNTFSSAYGSGMRLHAMLGVRFDKWVLGGAVTYDYSSFDGFDPASTFHGAGALLSAAFHLRYDLVSWFKLDAGIGSGWFASSYRYANLGLEHKDEVSLLLYGTPEFPLAKWFVIKVPVRIQMQLGAYGAEPNVYMAGRAEFSPFGDWLGLYAEFGMQPWVYSGSFFNTVSGLFVFSFGSFMDVPLGSRTAAEEVSE